MTAGGAGGAIGAAGVSFSSGAGGAGGAAGGAAGVSGAATGGLGGEVGACWTQPPTKTTAITKTANNEMKFFISFFLHILTLLFVRSK